MFIVYILCKNRKIFYRGCFCAFLAGQRSHLLIFIAVIYWLFPLFYLGQTFFAGKKGIAGPFYTGPFCAPIPQKTPRLYKHAALFGMPPRPTKGPRFGTPPTAKKLAFWGPVPQTLPCLRTQKAPRKKPRE